MAINIMANFKFLFAKSEINFSCDSGEDKFLQSLRLQKDNSGIYIFFVFKILLNKLLSMVHRTNRMHFLQFEV